MTNPIQNYRNVVDQPWGRMFYDLIFRQLNLSCDRRMKVCPGIVHERTVR